MAIANIKAFVLKCSNKIRTYWKALVGTIAFCFVLYERSKMKDLEVVSVESKANVIDSGLAQKQADDDAQVKAAEALIITKIKEVQNEDAAQVAKDLNNV